MPTLTYLAYADERMLWAEDIKHDDLTDRTVVPSDADIVVREHAEWGSSIYDFHRDHTGVCFASRRRPVTQHAARLSILADWGATSLLG